MMSAHRTFGWSLQNSRETCRAASPIAWFHASTLQESRELALDGHEV